MKATQAPVTVEMRDSRPHRVTWNDRLYPVTALHDQWRAGGRWWLGESARDCFLVDLGALTAELHREDASGRWWLARLQD